MHLHSHVPLSLSLSLCPLEYRSTLLSTLPSLESLSSSTPRRRTLSLSVPISSSWSSVMPLLEVIFLNHTLRSDDHAWIIARETKRQTDGDDRESSYFDCCFSTFERELSSIWRCDLVKHVCFSIILNHHLTHTISLCPPIWMNE